MSFSENSLDFENVLWLAFWGALPQKFKPSA
jgi:hypothetical protein